MRGVVAFGLLIGAVGLGPASAQDKLGALLDQLGSSETAPSGKVEVRGWLERSSVGSDLVVTLVPRGKARLIADPGLTITPLPDPGSPAPGPAVQLVDPSRDYLTEPPIVRVPLPDHRGGPVDARVDYTYCLVDYICLFGESEIRVEGGAPGT
jgi:hypothetical protein